MMKKRSEENKTIPTSRTKDRVGRRFKENVLKTSSKNRHVDLDVAAEKFKALKVKLSRLIIVLREQHASMVQLNEKRLQTAIHLAALSQGSPIDFVTGKVDRERPSSNRIEAEPSHRDSGLGAIVPRSSKTLENNYALVHTSLNRRSKVYADKYKQFVLNYAIEWEKTITTRVEAGLKTAEVFRRNLDHYTNKTESLRLNCHMIVAKGKVVDPKQGEKLRRNEEKLASARNEYEIFASSLHMLVEEVTDRAWKDMHPLLLKVLQFDSTLSADEAKILGDLKVASDELKKLAGVHNLNPKSRLKDLQSASPESLYTGGTLERTIDRDEPSGNILGGNSGVAVDLQNGSDFGSATPTGISEGAPFSSSNISAGLSKPTSTSQMLQVAANSAPAPTWDSINNDSVGNLASLSNVSVSAKDPSDSYHGSSHHLNNFSEHDRSESLHGNSWGADQYRSDSFHGNSWGADPTDAVAPAPSASPPPPPSAPPPPPPPTLSMYSSSQHDGEDLWNQQNASLQNASLHSASPSHQLTVHDQPSAANPWSDVVSPSTSNSYGQAYSSNIHSGAPSEVPQAPNPFDTAPPVSNSGSNPFGSSQLPSGQIPQSNPFGQAAPLSNPFG